MPKSTTSLSVVIRCLLSNACLIFSSNSFLYYSLSYCTYSFISFSASYSYSCTASRLSGSVSYSRAYAGVLSTCIYFTMQKNTNLLSPQPTIRYNRPSIVFHRHTYHHTLSLILPQSYSLYDYSIIENHARCNVYYSL